MCFLNWFHLHFNNTLACNKVARFSKFRNTQHTNHSLSFFLFSPPPTPPLPPSLTQPLTELNYKALLTCGIGGLLYFLLHIFSLHCRMIYLWQSYAYKIYAAPKFTLQWPKRQSWKSSEGWFTSESLLANVLPSRKVKSSASCLRFKAEAETSIRAFESHRKPFCPRRRSKQLAENAWAFPQWKGS